MSRNPKTVLKENALLKARLTKLTKPVERTWCYPCGGSGKRYGQDSAGWTKWVTCSDCGGSGKTR